MKTVEDLANQMKVVENLTTQMKENQVPSDLDIDKEVQVSTEVSTFMQPEESFFFFFLIKCNQKNLFSHIKFVIPEKIHEVEYRVYLFSMLPKSIPQLQQVLCAKVFIIHHFKTQVKVSPRQGSMTQEQNQNYLNFKFSDFCIYLIGNWIIVDFYLDRD